MISRAGLLAPAKSFDVLLLLEFSLGESHTLMEPRPVLNNIRAEAKSSVEEARRLEESVCTAEEDFEALRVARLHVDVWTSERTSLPARNEQVKGKRDTLAARIRKLEVAAATCYGNLCVVVRAVQSWKRRVAAESRALETVEMMF